MNWSAIYNWFDAMIDHGKSGVEAGIEIEMFKNRTYWGFKK